MTIQLADTDAKSVRKLVASDRWVVYDSETWLIGPGRVAPPLVCGTFAGPAAPKNVAIALKKQTLDILAGILADKTITAIGHNVAFDMGVLISNRPALLLPVFRAYEQGRVLDTMVIEKLRKIAHGWTKFDPRTGAPPKFDLAYLVSEYLGEQLAGKHGKDKDTGKDVWRLRYKELDGVELADWPVEAKTYAMDDATYTARVFQRQCEEVGSDAAFAGTLVDVRRQVMEAFALQMMSIWGFRTDSTAVDLLEHDLHEHVDTAVEYLLTKGLYVRKGVRVKKPPSLNMAAIRALVTQAFEARGEFPPLTKGGKKAKKNGEVSAPQVSTANETLIQSQHPDLEKLADIGGDKKLLTTYVPLIRLGTKWPINVGYNILVDTGRSSAFRPNIQNQPRKGGVRECFVPRPGHVFVACDYHTAELRSLAQTCLDRFGYSEMADALRQTEAFPHGKDLHLDMAAALLGIDYAEAEKRKKDKDVKDARQLSKALNFGLPGGLGANKFVDYAWKSYRVRITVDEAKKLKAQWLAKYPEMRAHFADIAAHTAGGALFTMKHVRSGRMRGGVGYCDGANSVFQGLTADGAKLACWAVVKESWTGWTWDEPIPDDATGPGPSPLYGFRPTGFIHDEILGESPIGKYQEHAARLSTVMIEAMRWFVPDVPVLAGAHAMYRWFKDAEETYDKEGNLVPWEPADPKEKFRKLRNDENAAAVDALLLIDVWSEADLATAHAVERVVLVARGLEGQALKDATTDWKNVQRMYLLNSFAKEAAHNV